jgi:RNA polymerase sigma factor (sigma-70 family)
MDAKKPFGSECGGHDQETMDDATLLRRYVDESSEPAFAELVSRHVGMVYGAARRQLGGDEHRARDIAQEVFTLLARKAPQLRDHPQLAGWLYTTTRWLVRRSMRAEHRRARREQEANVMSEVSPVWELARPLLDDALAALRASDRDLLVAHFFGGESYRSIAHRIALSEAAARMRVDRAVEKLRRKLASRGVHSTAAALATLCAAEGASAAPVGLAASVSSGALAAAAGTAGGVGILAFMGANKLVWGSLAAFGLLAAVSVHEAPLARDRAAQVAALTAERDQLRADLHARRTAAAQTPPAQAGAMGVGSPGAGAAAAANSPAAAPSSLDTAWSVTSPLNYAVEHPTARAAFIADVMLRAKAQFARFFAEAGLSPTERDALLQQFRTYAQAEFDYYAAVRSQGFGPMSPPQDPKALAGLLKMDFDITRSFDAQARQILGETRMAQFNAYVKALPAYNVADMLAARLYATDAPLTGAQVAQLVPMLIERGSPQGGDAAPTMIAGTAVSRNTIIAAKGASNLAHGTVIFPGYLDFSAPITDATLQQAAAVLSAGQLTALRELQAEQLARYQLIPPMPTGATTAQAIAAARNSHHP